MRIYLTNSNEDQFKLFFNYLKKYIKKGDNIYLELDLVKFGKIDNINISKKDFLDFFFKLFTKLVGKNGNIIVPTFSYSWGFDKEEKIFDVKNTKNETGIFPEYMLKYKNSKRSLDPMFSVTAFGPKKEYFTNCKNNAFGKNSFFEKIHKEGGKLISFGLNKFDPTFIHYIEQFVDDNIRKLKYRKTFELIGEIKNYDGKKYEANHYTFLRTFDTNRVFCEKKIQSELFNKNKLKYLKIINGNVFIVNSKDLFKAGLNGLKKDTNFFTKISSDHEDLLSIDYDKRPLKNNIKKMGIIKKNSFEDFINKAYEKTKVYDAEIIYIYSDFRGFGYFGSKNNNRNSYCSAIIEPLINKNKTIVVTTFTYTTKGKFDTVYTPTNLGVLNKWILNKYNVERSEHPIFSYAGIGPKASVILNKIGKSAFGRDGIFDRLYNRNVAFLHVGRPVKMGNTVIHHVEQSCNAKYRFDKKFNTKVYKNNKYIGTNYSAFVKKENFREELLNDFTKASMRLFKTGLINHFGEENSYTNVSCYPYDESVKFLKELMHNNPNIFLKRNLKNM